jgi:hypothetical protein
MFEFRRGILGLSVLTALGLTASIGCSDSIDDEPGGAGGGTGASGGAAGSGGATGSGGSGNVPACKPKDAQCYVGGDLNGPGNECLATRDNVGKTRVQIRSVWARSIAPAGNTAPPVYDILRLRSSIQWPECNTPNGVGGFMLMTDWDRSNTDKTMQTVRTGYATYHKSPAPNPKASDLVTSGLCMIQETKTQADDKFGVLALPANSGALPYPWNIGPRTSKRVMQDFTQEEMFAKHKAGEIALEDGVVFIDEEKGYIHGYTPLSWVTVLDTRDSGIAIPLRHFDIKSTFNDNTFNCAGRFRAEAMDPNRGCESSDPENPQWGCKDDNACPPPGYDDTGISGAGAGATYVKGHFLIVDLERIYSVALGATLCITNPGTSVEQQAAAGFGLQTADGANCRGGSKWDPSLPNDAGLPMGDWCSRENRAADANCHDAYRSLTYGAGQAFNIKDGSCPRGTY